MRREGESEDVIEVTAEVLRNIETAYRTGRPVEGLRVRDFSQVMEEAGVVEAQITFSDGSRAMLRAKMS